MLRRRRCTQQYLTHPVLSRKGTVSCRRSGFPRLPANSPFASNLIPCDT
jgi:hypothetical protein